jgi:cell wall-associated NlpC family hydrolase
VPLSRFWRCVATVVVGSTIGAGLVAGLPAWADPATTGAAADRVPSRPILDQQISDASNQLEIVIEQYNAARVTLTQTKAKEARVAKELIPLHVAVNKARAKVGRMAVGVYETDAFSSFSALVDAESATLALNQLSTLDELARARQAQIDTLYASAKVYTDRQARLAALDAKQSNTYAALAAKKKLIITQIAKLKALRLAAYGTVGLPAQPANNDFVPVYSPGAAGRAVKFAVAQIGKMYQWAAAGPDHYDCSGLTMAAWKAAGVLLPHNAAMQYRAVAHVSRTDLRPGDLVFYFNPVHHVALYLGKDKVVQAPEFGRPVSIADIGLAPIHGYGRPG